MTDKEKEKLYKKYEKLIKKIAWHYSYKTTMNIESLISEGNVVFCEALQTYDKEKASFCTYLYTCLKNRFVGLVTLKGRKRDALAIQYGANFDDMHYRLKSYDEVPSDLILRSHSLSSLGRKTVDLILNDPEHILSHFNSLDRKKVKPTLSSICIKQCLHDSHNVPWHITNDVIKELKNEWGGCDEKRI